ncbi:MAG: hypothetical protein ACK4ND_11900 [Cytophagaceae bacterium]
MWRGLICFITVLLLGFIPEAKAQFLFDFEGNRAFSGYNRIQIPGDVGTRFDANDLGSSGTTTLRFRAGYRIACKHDVLFLYAPFQQEYRGRLGEDVMFQNTIFDGANPTNVAYTFNSYRLTYRYFFLWGDQFRMAAGLTGKIRDASIMLSQGDQMDIKSDFGVVPLIHLYAEYKLGGRFGILLEGDGLATPMGRAFDYQLAIPYSLTEHLTARVGYRILEGGADVQEVYNFSMFHYGLVGASYNF